MAKAASPIPHGFHTLTPQLTLDNAAQTIGDGTGTATFHLRQNATRK